MAPRTNRTPATKPTPAAQPAQPVVEEPVPVILSPKTKIYGNEALRITQKPYTLTMYMDANTYTYVVAKGDEVLSVLRNLRSRRISMWALHVQAIVRLAINHSEATAAEYLEAAAFFDMHTGLYDAEQIVPVEMAYQYGDRDGYLIYAGSRVVFDSECTSDVSELLYRAVQPVNLFSQRYAQLHHLESKAVAPSPEAESLRTALNTSAASDRNSW